MFVNKHSIVTFAVVLLAYLVYEIYFKIQFSPIVDISLGSLRGSISKSRLGKVFYKFQGIEYAKSPIGLLRFEPPEPIDNPWTGVRDAISFGPKCIQVDALSSRTITGKEDCLYLNVYVPKTALESQALFPVIFYIHGGYFMMGTGNLMGPEFLMDDENIILITVNYRLNVFGFLNTEEGSVRGNMGLKDLHLALKWTKANIKNFGGDPAKVTIAGQSAGSAAVHFHLLSKLSKDLFSGAIMSSGTAIKPWSLALNPQEQAIHLAKLVNCSTVSIPQMVACLRSLDASDIVRAHMHALDSPAMNPLEIFAPSIETFKPDSYPDTFISEHPYTILKSGRGLKIPILTGLNSEEGLLATGRILWNASLLSEVESSWNELSPNFLFYDNKLKNVTAKIRKFYNIMGDDPSDSTIKFQENFQNITNAFSDRLYLYFTRETVQIQSKLSPIYLYYFNYRLKRGLTYLYDVNPAWPLIPQFVWKEIKWFLDEYIFKREHLFLGVIHGDDVALVFKFPMIDLSPGTEDFEHSRLMVKMWTQFAQDPTKLNFNGTHWPAVQPDDTLPFKYMLITNGESGGTMVKEPFSKRMEFWDEMNLPWKESPSF